ncbi:MAG TPA: SPFH domain-containing protein [Bacteroidales bacterium]|nr:SPFH domain-containing protein [Bacteroidales bacterium]
MEKEKQYFGLSGYLMVAVVFVLLGASISSIVMLGNLWFIIGIVFSLFLTIGFVVVNPNESNVLLLFGKYVGTIKKYGFYWVNPFFVKKNISLRARNLDSEPVKVNDKVGNPVMIGVVMVWRVENTYKAAFEVDNFQHFVDIQTEAAVRKLAGHYPYDNFNDTEAEITLRDGNEEVNKMLEEELVERLSIAGIHVYEARINYLAYASEIAGAMLKRQQAAAIVAARRKIVDGAVGMVEMALDELNKKQIVELDEDKKATMVSNLMVVLCSEKDTTPVINTGSLYQ